MQIILLQDVDNLGGKYDLVTVKDGYGRNFLIPQGVAVVANKANLGIRNERVRQTERRENKMLGTYQDLAKKANAAHLVFKMKAGASGRLFGSVTVQNIVDALKAETGIEIERKKVVLNEEVKELGSYTATVTFHKEAQSTVRFDVVAEGEAAPVDAEQHVATTEAHTANSHASEAAEAGE